MPAGSGRCGAGCPPRAAEGASGSCVAHRQSCVIHTQSTVGRWHPQVP
jgi:coenzyme F420-reducing hydrogenase gamma subunit